MSAARLLIISCLLGSLAGLSLSASVVVIGPNPDYNPVDLRLIGDRNVAEGDPVTLAVEASFDPDKIIHWIYPDDSPEIGELQWTFELLQGPDGMQVNPQGELIWNAVFVTQAVLTSQPVEVRATATEVDGDGRWTDTINGYVFVTPLAPHASEQPLRVTFSAGILGDEYIYIYDADDEADGEQLRFSLVDAPEGCHVTDQGRVYWQPPLEAEGLETEILLQVADGNEHGRGPSIIHLHATVTAAPKGAERVDTIFNSAAGFGRSISRDAERLAVGADQKGEVTVYVKQDLDIDNDTDPTAGNFRWDPEAVLFGYPERIEDAFGKTLLEINTMAFGASVSIDGDWLLVGAPLSSIDYGPFSDEVEAPVLAVGAAFFYRRMEGGGWRLHQVAYDHHNSDRSPNQFFGGSVALDGERALISNDSANNRIGEASYYRFDPDQDKWLRVRTFDHGDLPLQPGDYFSYPGVIDGGTLAIAANEDDAAGYNAGAVYLLENPDGYPVQYQKILPQFPQAGATFGYGLALEEDWLAIAAPSAFQLKGMVEIWHRGSDGEWRYYQSLSDSRAFQYGRQVNMEDGILAVAAPGLLQNEFEHEGRVYFYRFDGHHWTQILEHRQYDNSGFKNFGEALALAPDGSSLTVGAPGSGNVFELNLNEGYYPALAPPSDFVSAEYDMSDFQYLLQYQSNLTELDSTMPRATRLFSRDGQLCFEYPERTDARGFDSTFEYSRDLVEWWPLEDFTKLDSTRLEDGWLHRIAVEHPSGAAPFFIRQSVRR